MGDLSAAEMDPGELTLAEVEALEVELDAGMEEAFGDPRKRTRAVAAVIAANRRRTDPTVTTDEVMATLTMADVNRAAETAKVVPGVDPTAGVNGATPSRSPAPTG